MLMDIKNTWVRYSRYIVCAVICIAVILACKSIQARAEDEGDSWEYYKGVVTNTVNVRTGPGQEYDKVMIGEKSMQLSPQDEILIIGEGKASDGKVWYKVRFTYEGSKVEGYSTSSYIAKTDEKITPSPTPTPVPTNTPTPTQKAEPTNTPTPTAPLIKQDDQPANEKDKLMFIIVAVLAIVFVFIILLVVLRIIKSHRKTDNSPMSKRVDKLKKMNIEDGNGGNSGRRRPEVKKLEDEPPVAEEVRQDVYLKKNYDYAENPEMYNDPGFKKEASKEAEEKRALRSAIEKLQEHDIVIHKYFGEGEVYDNSDVKLLEVRFGNDVRFLNKDSLVSKKLLEICDEEQAVAKRRNASRRNKQKKSDY